MATLLYIEASPRKERSHSIRVANGFLDAYAAAHPADTIDRLDIWGEDLPPFDGDMINAKYTVMHGENPSGAEEAAWAEVQRHFDRFNRADKYLFAVPMWNFGLPYRLKHYIDLITQPGMAWTIGDSGYQGLVSGKAAMIYSSAGVYHETSGMQDYDLQKPGLEGWLAFIGITDVTPIIAAPALGAPDDVKTTMDAAATEAASVAQGF